MAEQVATLSTALNALHGGATQLQTGIAKLAPATPTSPTASGSSTVEAGTSPPASAS